MALCLNALLDDLNDDTSDGLDYIVRKRQVFNERLVGGLRVPEFASDLSPLYPLDAYSWQEYAIGALKRSFFKKFKDDTNPCADEAALTKFLLSQLRCQEWSIPTDRSLEDDLLLGLCKEELYRFFYPSKLGGSILSDFVSFFHKGDTGPGTSVGAHGTDFYTKICAGPLTGTRASLFHVYDHCIQNIPRWKHAEKARSSEYGGFTAVRGNRLSFVPKNVDVSRCISTEPLLNMFFQKGIGTILEERLRSYFKIDLADQQSCNRELAQIGSKHGNLCTIDLESASDSMSLRMTRHMLPRDVSRWLEWARSPEVQLPAPYFKDRLWMPLEMISTMGNAFTFPLQTLIFACVVSAVYKAQDIELLKGYRSDYQIDPKTRRISNTRRLPNFGVFGDDIIIEKQAYRQTVRLLSLLGFSVNAEKSFSEGHFRESCGGDFFDGRHVRGVYIKSLKTQAARYVAINRLNQWSAMTGISLARTVQRLAKSVRYLPVPLSENDDAGIKVPFHMVKNLVRCKDTQSVKYTKWISKARSITVQDEMLMVPGEPRSRFFNEDGLYLASLRGDIRNGKLGSRLGPTKYRTKEAITPFWDYLPPAAALEEGGFSQSQLVAAIADNLIS